jgi:hypothetical protein
MKRTLLALSVAVAGLLAACQADDATIGGTVLAVSEVQRAGDVDLSSLEESAKVYEDPLVPEVAWKVDVRLDNGEEVTVLRSRRYSPGDRVRLLKDSDGPLPM